MSSYEAPSRGSMRTRSLSGKSGVLMDDDAADVLAVEHVLVALVDLVKPVPARDQLVELEVTRLVQADEQRHVHERAAAAVDGALDPALVADQHPGVLVDHPLADGGDGDLTGLADYPDGVGDDLVGQDADGDDGVVGQLPPAGFDDEIVCLLSGGE